VHTSANELIAQFDENQVKSSIYFTDSTDGNTSEISIRYDIDESFKNSGEATTIKIFKKLPSMYSKCADDGKGSLVKQFTYGSGTEKGSINGTSSWLAHTIILYDSTNTMLACSVILSKAQVRYAIVTISNDKIAGKLEFIQNGEYETAVIGELSVADGTTGTISDVSWHIAKGTVSALDGTCIDDSLTILFNPTDQPEGTCTPQQHTACRMGDLTTKLGNIKIGSAGSETLFFIDTGIDVSDVVNHALVVHKNGGIKGCTNIMFNGPLNFHAKFTPAKHMDIDGAITFKQQTPYHPTTVGVNLKGLGKRVKAYHVHQYPTADNTCSPRMAGGHLNPYNVVQNNSPPPKNGTVDEYEMGDISGKFGYLTAMTTYNLSVADLNLPLYGPHTILGRSVVIHENDITNSRYVCANIKPVQGMMLKGLANFTANNYSSVDGYIQLHQWKLPNNIYTPTVIIVQVSNQNGLKTLDHNWHVHETFVNHNKDKTMCTSVGPHFNPHRVNVAKPAYSNQCSGEHPYRCEVGDNSAKCGTYNINNHKRLLVDVATPLYGCNTVLGRSFTLHKKSKAAARLACANIMPVVASTMVRLQADFNKVDMTDKNSMQLKLEKYFGFDQSERWMVNSLEMTSSSENSDCVSVSFYVMDENDSWGRPYKGKWNKINNGTEKLSGNMAVCRSKIQGSGSTSASLSMWLLLTVGVIQTMATLHRYSSY